MASSDPKGQASPSYPHVAPSPPGMTQGIPAGYVYADQAMGRPAVPEAAGAPVTGFPQAAGTPPQSQQGGAGQAAGSYVKTEPAKQGFLAKLTGETKKIIKQAETETNKAVRHLTAGGGGLNATLGVAWGKVEHTTRQVLAGGAEGHWRESFKPPPAEFLRGAFACSLSTEKGPVAGNIFVSNANLYFSSDLAIDYMGANGQLAKAYYRIVVPLEKLVRVEAIQNQRIPGDLFLKLTTQEGTEFWFLTFMRFEEAFQVVQRASAEARSHGAPVLGQPVPPGGVSGSAI